MLESPMAWGSWTVDQGPMAWEVGGVRWKCPWHGAFGKAHGMGASGSPLSACATPTKNGPEKKIPHKNRPLSVRGNAYYAHRRKSLFCNKPLLVPYT